MIIVCDITADNTESARIPQKIPPKSEHYVNTNFSFVTEKIEKIPSNRDICKYILIGEITLKVSTFFTLIILVSLIFKLSADVTRLNTSINVTLELKSTIDIEIGYLVAIFVQADNISARITQLEIDTMNFNNTDVQDALMIKYNNVINNNLSDLITKQWNIVNMITVRARATGNVTTAVNDILRENDLSLP